MYSSSPNSNVISRVTSKLASRPLHKLPVFPRPQSPVHPITNNIQTDAATVCPKTSSLSLIPSTTSINRKPNPTTTTGTNAALIVVMRANPPPQIIATPTRRTAMTVTDEICSCCCLFLPTRESASCELGILGLDFAESEPLAAFRSSASVMSSISFELIGVGIFALLPSETMAPMSLSFSVKRPFSRSCSIENFALGSIL
mmetsp:Transcript_505/g.926  ORF Transcript_505/g.926 Transcript_505/m.926 type:complete len:201 (-) Transcript_505:931-1533(-)